MPLADVTLITCCSKRKRRTAGAAVSAQANASETPAGFAGRWTTLLARTPKTSLVRDLYVGRGFSEVRSAAARLNAEMFVVSAGLGLVAGDEWVPVYGLTVAAGPGSLLPWLQAREALPSAWWNALTEANGQSTPLANAVRARRNEIVLVGLPSTYVDLVRDDLASLSRRDARALRLLTSERGRERVPDHLQEYVMPYDDRLEGTSYAGTRADFPQRALAHFVAHVAKHRLSPLAASDAVRAALQGAKRPELPVRVKRSDEQIATLLRKQWKRHGGASSTLLRYLRDEALVQCEQGRFRLIWKAIGEEYAA